MLNLKIKASFIIVLFFFNYIAKSQSQFEVNFPEQSVGTIMLDKSTPIGTGFVLLNNHFVVTCNHVAKVEGDKWYFPLNSSKMYKLNLILFVKKGDIALFRTDDSIPTTPLIADTTFVFKNNSTIGYIGYDAENSSPDNLKMSSHIGKIEANGRMDALVQGNEIGTSFIEFIGRGLPGYSGSPIFNNKGEVIAILSMAYYRANINYEEKVLVNRGLTIKPLVKAYKSKK